MSKDAFSGKPSQTRKTRWLRLTDLPFCRATSYRMIEKGLLVSISLRLPGSRRTIRLIDAESLDRYVLKLGREQQAARAETGQAQ
jgi:hypothetical protein